MPRAERWLEGTFWRRARLEGNDVGYTSILASGPHATTLHWWRNNGPTLTGQLLLADMGVETDELYTADVTRTMPIDGSYTPEQLRIYRAVYEAQSAGIAEVKAGADFLAAHRAAMWVLADHLHSWGILPVTADVSCADDPERPGAGLHRRYTLHATSHMLGIDVHDCALARREVSTRGTLVKGHVLTVEPGSVLPGQRPHGAERTAGHRGANRGRHRRHRRGTDEPFGVAPSPPGRGHRLDGRRARGRRPGRDAARLMPTSSRIPPTGDLHISRGPGLPRGLVVPERELIERFSHSPGAGGQSVNTADSRVELRWDVAASDVLTEAQRARLLARLRLTTDGTVSVLASEHRSQLRNRVAARQRLAKRIATALVPDTVRQPTRPSRAARAARVADKRRRGELKAARRRVGPAD